MVAAPAACGTGAGALPRAASRMTAALQPMAFDRRRANRTGSSPSNVTRCRGDVL
jgi:hypothetical protein